MHYALLLAYSRRVNRGWQGRVKHLIACTDSHESESELSAAAAAATRGSSQHYESVSSLSLRLRSRLDNTTPRDNPWTVWTRQATLDAATHGARLSSFLHICFLVPCVPQVYLQIFRPREPTLHHTPQQQVPPSFTPVALGVLQRQLQRWSSGRA